MCYYWARDKSPYPLRRKACPLASTKRRNLVIIGGDLWNDAEKHSQTSFCKHIDQELRRAGSDIDVIPFSAVDLGMKSNKLFLHLPDGRTLTQESEDLPRWAICYVIPPRATFALEQLGIPCFSSYAMSSLLEDKMITHAMYASLIDHPDTLFFGSDTTLDRIIFDEASYPFMLKGALGQGGVNVCKAYDTDQVMTFADERADASELVMLQEAMPTANDLRVYCLGDEIIGAVLREPREGIWKANLEFGPRRSEYKLSFEEKALVREAMSLLPQRRRGLYSFDFLFDAKGGLVMCEANCNVGTNGLDAAGLGDKIFLRYVDYVRREVQRDRESS